MPTDEGNASTELMTFDLRRSSPSVCNFDSLELNGDIAVLGGIGEWSGREREDGGAVLRG